MIVGGRLVAVRVGRLWRISESELGRIESGAPAAARRRPPSPPPRPTRRFARLVRELPYAGPDR
jgi:hypothetical protein